jgi:hypothetical protein
VLGVAIVLLAIPAFQLLLRRQEYQALDPS